MIPNQDERSPLNHSHHKHTRKYTVPACAAANGCSAGTKEARYEADEADEEEAADEDGAAGRADAGLVSEEMTEDESNLRHDEGKKKGETSETKRGINANIVHE